MQTTTSGSKKGVDISYTFSQKTTVPEKGKKILKLFQDNLKRYLARIWRTWEGNKKKKNMWRDCVVSMKVEADDDGDDDDDKES